MEGKEGKERGKGGRKEEEGRVKEAYPSRNPGYAHA